MNGRRALHVFVGLGFLLGSVGAILTPPCHPYSIHLRAVDSAGVDEPATDFANLSEEKQETFLTALETGEAAIDSGTYIDDYVRHDGRVYEVRTVVANCSMRNLLHLLAYALAGASAGGLLGYLFVNRDAVTPR